MSGYTAAGQHQHQHQHQHQQQHQQQQQHQHQLSSSSAVSASHAQSQSSHISTAASTIGSPTQPTPGPSTPTISNYHQQQQQQQQPNGQGASPSKPNSLSQQSAAAAASRGPAATAGMTGQYPSNSSKRDQRCAHCNEPMTGQFVRALGAVYHLDCFRCHDCGKIVAAKFFPATDDMVDPASSADKGDGKQIASTSSSKLFPLCETDYFKRLDLLCAKCGCALRGSYITALGMKFHVEHFTCSVCPTVFGPHDSYYEHDSRVYCHFHYSTRFAIKCTGCRTAILKQFVEINRNNVDEHWHPECYMIHKFWNIKICPTGSTPKEGSSNEHHPTQLTISDSTKSNMSDTPGGAGDDTNAETTAGLLSPSASGDPATFANPENVATTTTSRPEPPLSAEAVEAETSETPATLRQKQRQMEQQVYRIWTVLSAFEESSAACISEMLRHVSHGRYLDGVKMAEKFILHVEILFSAIDDLEVEFRKEHAKGISHIREARMLCKKIVNFFSLLSHTQETGARRMDITQELLSLVTGLAHYLKILIRIALSGALRLDRDFNNHAAIQWFLSQLAFLAREGTLSGEEKFGPNGGAAPTAADALVKSGDTPGSKIEGAPNTISKRASGLGPSNGKWYGYKSLPRAATRSSSTSTEPGESATDLCVQCGQTVEEDCFRFGVPRRWHASCLKCTSCERPAALDPSVVTRKGAVGTVGKVEAAAVTAPPAEGTTAESGSIPEAVPAAQFVLEIIRSGSQLSQLSLVPSGSSSTAAGGKAIAHSVFCPTCAMGRGQVGFEAVTRLEQYAFLLRVALNRLFALLKKRGVVPPSPPTLVGGVQPLLNAAGEVSQQQGGGYAGGADGSDIPMHEAYRDSADFKRMKSVNLDRKVSTKARVPHISTVMASPSGRQPTTASPTAMGSSGLSSGDAAKAGGDGGVPRSPQTSNAPSQNWLSSSPVDKEQPRVPRRSESSIVRPPLPTGGLSTIQQQPQRDLSPSRRPQHPQQQQQLNSGPGQGIPHGGGPQTTEPGSIVPIRPAFARHNTDVRIRNDGPMREPSGDDGANRAPLGDTSAEDGITLADIPHILEAEQHRGLPHSLSNNGRHISELSALELFIIKHMAVMVLQQSALKDMIALDDLLEFIETRKNTFWGKIFKGGDKKKEVKKKGVFGIPLEILVDRNGADSTLGASASHLRVPSFIDDIISAMKQMDVSVEGIFRKNGNIRRLKELSEALDRDPSQVNLLDDNPVQLAALLKKWLRELPDPLLTFKLHKLFVASQKLEETERLRILRMVTMLLPKGHRDTMEVLFVFLKWVASFSHVDEETGSKMDLQNLALVLGPNILYSKGADPTKDETFLANAAIMQLLDNQDDFWTVPEDLEGILQDRELLNPQADLTSRDILKRCERFATRRRANTNGGTAGMPHPAPAFRAHHGQVSMSARASDGLHVETVSSRHQTHLHAANARPGPQGQHQSYSQPASAVDDPNGRHQPPPPPSAYGNLRSAPPLEGSQGRRSSFGGPVMAPNAPSSYSVVPPAPPSGAPPSSGMASSGPPGRLPTGPSTPNMMQSGTFGSGPGPGPASSTGHGPGQGSGSGPGQSLSRGGAMPMSSSSLGLGGSTLPGATLPPNQPRTPLNSLPSTPSRERERPVMDPPNLIMVLLSGSCYYMSHLRC
ncbi:unnamed protein product [Tilletia controversa]|nr:unnamed protein product [Tilletia controversa]